VCLVQWGALQTRRAGGVMCRDTQSEAKEEVSLCQLSDSTNKSCVQEQRQFIGGGYSEFRSIGAFTFDGKGKGTRVTTIWYSDFHVNAETTFPIAYEVHPDCRFDLTYTDNGETFTGVIDNAGQKLLYLEISGDPMRSGQAERIAAAQNAH
jgi:hypothetical protein